MRVKTGSYDLLPSGTELAKAFRSEGANAFKSKQ